MKFALTCAPPWNALNGMDCVKCRVVDVRMRFPCQSHVGIGDGGESVVCVTTLRVIGIPSVNGAAAADSTERANHSFPWHAEFEDVSDAEVIVFEVNVHQNNMPEFLIPHPLYKHRLENLERALIHHFRQEQGDRQRLNLRRPRQRNPINLEREVYSKVNLLSYFAEDGGREDAVFDPHYCHIQSIAGLSQSRDGSALICAGAYDGRPDGQLPQAGYDCISVKYICGSEVYISPWEVDVVVPSAAAAAAHEEDALITRPLQIPALSQDAVHFLSNHLNKITSEVEGSALFMNDVPDNYRDYLQMTPTPMNIEFLKTRVLSRYYSHIEGVLQDARCLWENCLKYNTYNEDDRGICNDADAILQYVEDGCSALTAGGDGDGDGGDSNSVQHEPVVMVEVEAVNLNDVHGYGADEQDAATANGNVNNNLEPAENVMAAATMGRGRRGVRRRRGRNTSTSNSVLENLANNANRLAAPVVADNSFGNAAEHGLRRSSRAPVPRILLGGEEAVGEVPNARRSSRIRSMPPAAAAVHENPIVAMANNFHESSSASPSSGEDSSAAEMAPVRSNSRRSAVENNNSSDSDDEDDEGDDGVSAYTASPSRSSATPMQRRVASTAKVRVSLRSSDLSEQEEVLEAELPSRQDGIGLTEHAPSSSSEASASAEDMSESEASVPSDEEDSDDDSSSSIERKPRAKPGVKAKAINDKRQTIKKRHTKARNAKYSEEDGNSYGTPSDDDEESQSFKTRSSKRSKSVAGTGRKRKAGSAYNNSSPAKSTRNHGRRAAVSYQDISHSEISEEDSNVGDENLSARGGRKRKSTAPTPAKKRKKISASPTIPQWPTLQRRQLKKVSKVIFDMVKEKDVDRVFYQPVTDEQAPGYNSTIDQPMDFFTIEKKLSSYKDVNDFREDLILIFENCCYFNGKGEYWDYAMDIWKSLPEIFSEACKNAGIPI